MLSPAADDHAAVVFDDLASALDAGLPLESVGGDPAAGDRVLHAAARARGVRLTETEDTVLEAGWRAGRASTALRARAAGRRQRAEFGRTVWRSVSYPIALLAMLLVASAATMALIGPWPLVVVATVELVLLAVTVYVWRGLARGHAGVERWPVVGRLVQDLREVPYLETLHALYGAGVPILDAHQAAVAAVRMQDLRRRLAIADTLLHQGEPLRDALAQAAALTQETRELLATGEQAGQLEAALPPALTRSQEVAARSLTVAARRIGGTIYVLGIVGTTVLIFLFYGSYFGRIAGALR